LSVVVTVDVEHEEPVAISELARADAKASSGFGVEPALDLVSARAGALHPVSEHRLL